MEEKEVIIDDSKVIDYFKIFESMKDELSAPLTEEIMLEATLEHQKEDSYEDFIKYWILHLLDPELQVYKLWKDFFIRHGYINEKEEIIYKPEEQK